MTTKGRKKPLETILPDQNEIIGLSTKPSDAAIELKPEASNTIATKGRKKPLQNVISDQHEIVRLATKPSDATIELKPEASTVISDQHESIGCATKPTDACIEYTITLTPEASNTVTPNKQKDNSDSICTVSPKKRLNFLPTRKITDEHNAGPRLEVYAFDPNLPIEAYLYIKDEHNDGFMVGIMKFCTTETLNSEELKKANFTSYLSRRLPNTNQTMNSSKKFPRAVVLRYVPTRLSTKKTRQNGLQVLSKFLNSDQNTRYIGHDIPIIDKTNEADPHALDSFFLDDDIESIIRNVFDEDELNQDFYTKYNKLALKLWSGKLYSDFARQLGFP